MTTENVEVLTLIEAGRRLRIHQQSVRELIWAGQLDWVDVGTGKRPRIRTTEEAIKDFIARRTNKAPNTKAAA